MPNRSTLFRRRLKAERPDQYALYLARKNELRRQKAADVRKDMGITPRPAGLSPAEKTERRREQRRAWRENNIEKLREQRRAWYHANKDKERRQHLRWAQKKNVAERRRAANRERLADPRNNLVKTAKGLIGRAIGTQKNLPKNLVEAEIIRLMIGRAIRGRGLLP